jgi:hypothetical protein
MKTLLVLLSLLPPIVLFGQTGMAVMPSDSLKQDSLLRADFDQLRETIYSLPIDSAVDNHAVYRVVFSAEFPFWKDQFPVQPRGQRDDTQELICKELMKAGNYPGQGSCSHVIRLNYRTNQPGLVGEAEHLSANGHWPATDPLLFSFGGKYVIVRREKIVTQYGETFVAGYQKIYFLEKVP